MCWCVEEGVAGMTELWWWGDGGVLSCVVLCCGELFCVTWYCVVHSSSCIDVVLYCIALRGVLRLCVALVFCFTVFYYLSCMGVALFCVGIICGFHVLQISVVL